MSDHLSVRVTSDSAGANRTEQAHYPFGEQWYNSSGAKLLFTSYERDAESGNDYAVFRSHIPRLGRFNRPDPVAGSIAAPQSLNRFGYVLNSPVNLTDAMGLAPCGIEGFRDCHPLIEGGDPSGFGCVLDGISVGCSWVSRQTIGMVAARCPNDDCRPVFRDGQYWHFEAHTNGVGAYYPTQRPGHTFATIDEALAAGARWAQAQALDMGREFCGLAYGTSGGTFSFTSSVEGAFKTCDIDQASRYVPTQATVLGGYHAHGRDDPGYYNNRFSGQLGDCSPGALCGDRGWSIYTGLPVSVATPGGHVIIYNPNQGCQRFIQGSPDGTGTTIPVCP